MFRRNLLTCLTAIALVFGACQNSQADLAEFCDDFESADAGGAFIGNGWRYFMNAFPDTSVDPNAGYYNYSGDAPNGPQITALASGEGGVDQGAQYINIYTDYNNGDLQDGSHDLENNVFQEQVVGSADVGTTWCYEFDYKASSTNGPSGATDTIAFIKLLDPANGFADVIFPTNLNTTSASGTVWDDGKLSVTIDSSYVGHILQFGFASTVSDAGDNAGVFYDNIKFTQQVVPEPGSMAIMALGLAGLAVRRRRS